MVELIPRDEALALHRDLAGAVLHWQRMDSRVASTPKERREAQAWLRKHGDSIGSSVAPREAVEERYLLPVAGEQTFAEALAPAFSRAVSALNARRVCFLPESRTPWLPRARNQHPAAKACKATLTALLHGHRRFDGALAGGRKSLRELLPAVFRLARYFPAAPRIHFAAEGVSNVFSLCHYGVLHVQSPSERAAQRVRRALRGVGFQPVESCVERFAPDGAIAGRRFTFEAENL